jgi:hypothetical protein
MIGTPYRKNSGNTSTWFDIYTPNLDVTVFYKQSIEEKKSLLLAEIKKLEEGEQASEQSI